MHFSLNFTPERCITADYIIDQKIRFGGMERFFYFAEQTV
jgi:hypothetical protein